MARGGSGYSTSFLHGQPSLRAPVQLPATRSLVTRTSTRLTGPDWAFRAQALRQAHESNHNGNDDICQ
jgi:hypothetical protein